MAMVVWKREKSPFMTDSQEGASPAGAGGDVTMRKRRRRQRLGEQTSSLGTMLYKEGKTQCFQKGAQTVKPHKTESTRQKRKGHIAMESSRMVPHTFANRIAMTGNFTFRYVCKRTQSKVLKPCVHPHSQ